MKKVHLIFCSDYNFQIIQVLPNTTLEEAWDEANKLFSENPQLGESYDVLIFDSIDDMNSYVREECKKNKRYVLELEKKQS